MVDFEYKDRYTVDDFREIMRVLRSEDGCPWDREQTHESIRRNLLEEAYEVCEAIDAADSDHLKEELGDLLMQVIFHSLMEEECGRFDLDGVADYAVRKLIFRHPHVFGEGAARVEVSGSEEVLNNWEELKRRERGDSTVTGSLVSVAKSLPALWRAEKIQQKASRVGFDWAEISGALDKLTEEVDELRVAIAEAADSGSGTTLGSEADESDTNEAATVSAVTEELGDLLFAAVNVARFAGVDPEMALGCSSDKFTRRFAYIEEEAARRKRKLEDMTLEELDAIYEEGKRQGIK